ncbi:hypothetical protein P3G55_25475, partial [Leptospira sp. 96542]|nr:hypothetical protein [Leptospira sp. 96542]
MSRPRARALRGVTILALAALVTACSTLQFGYGQLPRLAAWQLDSYLDLDRAQSRQLDVALAELHAWHRREELPRVRAVLSRVAALWRESALGGDRSGGGLD